MDKQAPVDQKKKTDEQHDAPQDKTPSAQEVVSDLKKLHEQATQHVHDKKAAAERGTLSDEQAQQKAVDLVAKLSQKSIKTDLDQIKNPVDRDNVLKDMATILLQEKRDGKDIDGKLDRLKDPKFSARDRNSETSRLLGGKPVLIDNSTGSEVVPDRTKPDYDRVCQFMRELVPPTLEQIEQSLYDEKAPAAERNKSFEQLSKYLEPTSKSDKNESLALVLANPKDATKSEVEVLAKYAGPAGLAALKQSGEKAGSADALQGTADNALIQIMKQAKDPKVAAAAFDALARRDWPADCRNDNKAAASEYVKAHPEDTYRKQKLDAGAFGADIPKEIASRLALFNALSPALRKELGGFEDPLDPRQVEGQIANGSLARSNNSFLLEGPPQGKSLEEKVKEKQEGADNQAKDLEGKVKRWQELRSSQLRTLTDDVKDGEKDKQPFDVDRLKHADEGLALAARQLYEAKQRQESLHLASQVFEYERKVGSGDRKGADLIGLDILKDHKPEDLNRSAPSVYTDMVEHHPDISATNGLERLHQAGLIQHSNLPADVAQPEQRFNQALGALANLKVDQSRGGSDTDEYRANSLRAVDADPNLQGLNKIAQVFDRDLTDLSKMCRSGMEGKKAQEFVDAARDRAKEMQAVLKDSDDHPERLQQLRDRVQQMKDGLERTTDQKAQEELKKRIEAADQMVNLLDPNSSGRKQVDEILNEVQSRDFDADTLVKRLKTQLPAMVGAIAVSGAVIASMGEATPLAMVLYGSGGMLAGSEMTKQILFDINHTFGDTGLGGLNEESRLGSWVDATIDKYAAIGDDPQSSFGTVSKDAAKRFLKDVVGPLGLEYGFNVGAGLLTLGVIKMMPGAGAAASEVVGAAASNGLKIEAATLKQALASEEVAELAAQAENAAGVAAKSQAASSFLRAWAKECGVQTIFTGLTEGAQWTAEKAHLIKEGNSAFSLGVSLGLAIAAHKFPPEAIGKLMGKDLPVDPKYVQAVAEQLRNAGHTVVEREPGVYEVTPFNAAEGAAPFVMRRADATYKGPAHSEAPGVRQGEGPAGSAGLPTEGWFVDATRKLMSGDFKGAYEVARQNPTKPQSTLTVPVEISAQELLGGGQAYAQHLVRLQRESAIDTINGGTALVEPRTEVKLNSGRLVDILDPPANLTGRDLEDFNKVVNSDQGKRILAEHAMIRMEEGFHLRQQELGQPISSTYKEFLASGSEGAAPPGTEAAREQEMAAAMYDAGGMPLDQIRKHFEGLHPGRQPVMDFLATKEGNLAIEKVRQAGGLQEQDIQAISNALKNNRLAPEKAAAVLSKAVEALQQHPEMSTEGKASLMKSIAESKFPELELKLGTCGLKPEEIASIRDGLSKGVNSDKAAGTIDSALEALGRHGATDGRREILAKFLTDISSSAHPDLPIPFDRLLSGKFPEQNLKYYFEKMAEVANNAQSWQEFKAKYPEYVRKYQEKPWGPGDIAEQIAAKKTLELVCDGAFGDSLFIPSGKGAFADKLGLDGVFFDPTSGRMTPVDFTTGEQGKVEKGRDQWVLSLGDNLAQAEQLVKSADFSAKLREHMTRMQIGNPPYTFSLSELQGYGFSKLPFGDCSGSPAELSSLQTEIGKRNNNSAMWNELKNRAGYSSKALIGREQVVAARDAAKQLADEQGNMRRLAGSHPTAGALPAPERDALADQAALLQIRSKGRLQGSECIDACELGKRLHVNDMMELERLFQVKKVLNRNGVNVLDSELESVADLLDEQKGRLPNNVAKTLTDSWKPEDWNRLVELTSLTKHLEQEGSLGLPQAYDRAVELLPPIRDLRQAGIDDLAAAEALIALANTYRRRLGLDASNKTVWNQIIAAVQSAKPGQDPLYEGGFSLLDHAAKVKNQADRKLWEQLAEEVGNLSKQR
jgi:hypothetical protein